MTVVPVTTGGEPAPRVRSTRTTVHFPVTGMPLGVVFVLPPSALETKSAAEEPFDSTAMSHGPTMWVFVMVSTGVPWSSRTVRHPAGLRFGRAPPLVVGRLPTTTQP